MEVTQTVVMRIDGRSGSCLRPVSLLPRVNRYAEGSALIHWGNTQVLCTASIEEKIPSFLRGTGRGWLTAEYAMLPRATHTRTSRDVSRGKLNGRGSEIQRLIGRALRAAVDMDQLGERSILIDCDVLQADGGTRTASITAAFVAVAEAIRSLYANKIIASIPIKAQVAAVSVGKVDGTCLLDLCYEEDSRAEVDANLVMVHTGDLVEIQGTAEQGVFSRTEMNTFIDLAWGGIQQLHALQLEALNFTAQEEKAVGFITDRCGKHESA